MAILVTGGAGFIGSNFVKYMLEKYPDYEIVNLDALTYCGNLENLEDIEDNPNYTFVKGDIQDEELVDSIVKDTDYIVHFAAESHVDRSIEDPQIFIKTNIIGTQVLLDAAKKHNIKKFLQVSTDEVYGSLGKEGYFTEESPLQANSPYSASKAGLIGLTKSMAKEMGPRGIRANCIAPGFIATDMTGALPENVRQEWEKQIPLRRGGTPEDVAGVAVFLASDLAGYVTGQVVNCCGGMNC